MMQNQVEQNVRKLADAYKDVAIALNNLFTPNAADILASWKRFERDEVGLRVTESGLEMVV